MRDIRGLASPRAGVRAVVGLSISVALHVFVFSLALRTTGAVRDRPEPPQREQRITVLLLRLDTPETPGPRPASPAHAGDVPPAPPISRPVPAVPERLDPVVPRQPASMAAPPAPTAAEWAFASTYPLKNSKGYRYTWGQQVRSMMGTAVEGPDQGMVRFRIEISADGRLTRLETLWSTSPVAERLARRAIDSMPQWPPTPTGKPLIFDRTLSFSPFSSDGPPLYRDDCQPDPPVFRNPYAWDGGSPPSQSPVRNAPPADRQSIEDCLRQLPQDSIEAESARDQRLMDQWGRGGTRPDR